MAKILQEELKRVAVKHLFAFCNGELPLFDLNFFVRKMTTFSKREMIILAVLKSFTNSNKFRKQKLKTAVIRPSKTIQHCFHCVKILGKYLWTVFTASQIFPVSSEYVLRSCLRCTLNSFRVSSYSYNLCAYFWRTKFLLVRQQT